jgi:hypothetical protein
MEISPIQMRVNKPAAAPFYSFPDLPYRRFPGNFPVSRGLFEGFPGVKL